MLGREARDYGAGMQVQAVKIAREFLEVEPENPASLLVEFSADLRPEPRLRPEKEEILITHEAGHRFITGERKLRLSIGRTFRIRVDLRTSIAP